jgi:hypothetical protein
MDQLDNLLKTLKTQDNDPNYISHKSSPSTFAHNRQAVDELRQTIDELSHNSPIINYKKYAQQEPTPDQSPLKSPIKPNQYSQMMSPSLKNEQPSGMKLQQNNMPNNPYLQKTNRNRINSPSLNAINSTADKKIDDIKLQNKSQSTPNLSPQISPAVKPTNNTNSSQKSSSGQKQSRKIICATCKEPIKGKVVSCLGKTWHPEHFICQAGCKKLLDPNRFFEKNHLPCCENCHRESFVPRCAYCGDVINEKCITALGTTWHTDHFFCCQCAVQFPAGSGFLEKDGKAYCERDYYRLFATRCGKCGEIIVGEYISALNKEWHNKCFTCKECGCPFPTESFFEYKGMPYCETHYHLKRGSLCSRCNKPIVGRCISASGKKYHPDHFTCVKCNKLLATGNMDDEYKEVNGHPFCGNCAARIRF